MVLCMPGIIMILVLVILRKTFINNKLILMVMFQAINIFKEDLKLINQKLDRVLPAKMLTDEVLNLAVHETRQPCSKLYPKTGKTN
jgi:hypothetical protein